MKNIIILLTLFTLNSFGQNTLLVSLNNIDSSLMSNTINLNLTPQSTPSKRNNAVLFAAGTSFLIAGLLQRPDQVWVPDTKSQFTNTFGEPGYFRDQKFYECKTKLLALTTGAIMMSFSIIYKF